MKRYVLIILLVLISVILLSACAADASTTVSAPPVMPAPALPAPVAPPADSEIVEAAPGPLPAPLPTPALDSPTAGTAQMPILTPSDEIGRHLTYTVDLQLQTTDFDAGNHLLKETVGEMGGYVEYAYVRGRDMRTPEIERSATYIFRLPTERLAEFIVVMHDNYNLLGLWQGSDDVTMRYEYDGMTLSDLREQEARIRENLDDPDLDAADKNELERTLSDLLSHIRNLEAHMVSMEHNIVYSIINVHLYEIILNETGAGTDDLTFGERFNNAASRSWGGFIAFLEGLLIVIIRILPTLLILGVIAVGTYFLVRFCKKKSKERSEKRPPKQPESTPEYIEYQNWNNANQNYYDPNAVYNDPNTYYTAPGANDAAAPGDNNEQQ